MRLADCVGSFVWQITYLGYSCFSVGRMTGESIYEQSHCYKGINTSEVFVRVDDAHSQHTVMSLTIWGIISHLCDNMGNCMGQGSVLTRLERLKRFVERTLLKTKYFLYEKASEFP